MKTENLFLELSSNLLHNLVSCGTYGTILHNLAYDIFDQESELMFDQDIYFDKLYNKLLFDDAVVQSVKDNVFDKLTILGIDITFDIKDMVSPKYYNYSNDSVNIDVTINENKVNELISNSTFAHEFDMYLRETYKNGPGYINLMPSSIDEFVETSDIERKFASMINYLLELKNIEKIDEEFVYYEILDQYNLFDFIDPEKLKLHELELKMLDDLIIKNFKHRTIEQIDIQDFIDNSETINVFDSVEDYIKNKVNELKNTNQFKINF